MRGRIFDRLFARMANDPKLFLLTADMGINLVERFQQVYRQRFVNVGIAEQNLIGIAAGLANVGFRPFVYTISNFLVHRCFEQIRNDLVMHGHPAVLLGTSAGYDNAPLGATHHIIEDWGSLATIPDIDIYTPSGIDYADALVDRLATSERAAYVRIPKGQPQIPGGTADAFLLPGKSKKVLLISYGGLVQDCMQVQKERDDVSLLILNCVRPLDQSTIIDAAQAHTRVLTVEDHRPESGLYGHLCRLWVEHRLEAELQGLGARPGYPLDIGASPAYYHRLCGIDAAGIRQAITSPAHRLLPLKEVA